MKEREGKPGMRFQNSLINFQFSIKNSLRNRTGFQNFSFFPFGSVCVLMAAFGPAQLAIKHTFSASK